MAHTSQDKSRKPFTSAATLSSAQIDAAWDTGVPTGAEKAKGHAAPKTHAAPAWVFKAPQGGKRLNPPKLPRATSKSVPPARALASAPVPKSKASSFPPPPSSRRLPAVPTPPRPHAAASPTRRAVEAATVDLRDIPEIDPEEDETLAQASAEPASLDVLANRESTIAPSSIAPTISDLEVVDFAQRARRNQSTRVLLALALVSLVGIGISVGVHGAPPSAAQQSLPMSAAAVAPPTQRGQMEDLEDRREPVATVMHSAVQTDSTVVERRVPLAAPAADSAEVSTAAPTPRVVPRPPAADTTRTAKLARRQQRGAEQAPESATSSAAIEGGASWLVRLQQQEASKASSER